MKVILDTDIGTDVDDSLALALILSSPEIELLGISCVYGDVLLRSQIAIKYLALAGRADIPVYCGASNPLLNIGDIYWGGHEGKEILTNEDNELKPQSQFAVDYLIETVLNHPNEIHIIAIGPLTNIAMALQKAPEFAEHVAHLTIMGGVLRDYSNLDLPIAEHNIKCDPEAAHIVLSSKSPITLVPLNITVQTLLDKNSVQRIRAGGSVLHHTVARELETYPRFQQYGQTSPHDPLAVATLIQPQIVTTKRVSALVDFHNPNFRGAIHFNEEPDGNIDLVSSVESPTFKELMLSRISKPFN